MDTFIGKLESLRQWFQMYHSLKKAMTYISSSVFIKNVLRKLFCLKGSLPEFICNQIILFFSMKNLNSCKLELVILIFSNSRNHSFLFTICSWQDFYFTIFLSIL